MIEVKLLNKHGNPIEGACIMLQTLPYAGEIAEIAALTNALGVVCFDCKSVKGQYTFRITLESGTSTTLTVQNTTETDVGKLILQLQNCF